MTRSQAANWLQESHVDRHRAGRAATAQRRQQKQSLHDNGHAAIAAHMEIAVAKESVAYMRNARRRDDAEAERAHNRLGAAIRKALRAQQSAKRSASSNRFAAWDRLGDCRPPHPSGRSERDLYYDWIGRGFGSGTRPGTGRSSSPRDVARRSAWSVGEFGDKIDYIERDDGLEQVAGNIISNMGSERHERRACADKLEELERAGRKSAGVYHHNILALPADLSPQGRAELMAELCAHLERLRLPFTATLHKPSATGNQNNFHAHVVMSLRPMIKTGTHFEFEAGKRTWLDTPAGLKLQRRVIATAFNEALARENLATRWTHRSRAADGLAPPGNTKRGAALERTQAAEKQANDQHGAAQEFVGQLEMATDTIDLVDGTFKALARAATQLDASLGRQIDIATDELKCADIQCAQLTGLSDQLDRLERANHARSTDAPERGHVAHEGAEVLTAEPTPAGAEITTSQASQDQEAQSRREREDLFAKRHARAVREKNGLAADEKAGAEELTETAQSSADAEPAEEVSTLPATDSKPVVSLESEFTAQDLARQRAFLDRLGRGR